MDKNINFLESLAEFSGSRSDRISKTEEVFTKICRTCLTETNDNTLDSIVFLTNNSQGISVTLKEMMEACTGLQFNTEDKLPRHICNGCLKAIESAYLLRIHSQRIDMILRGFLEQLHTMKDETGGETESSLPVPIKSEEIDEPTDAIQFDDYQVTYIKEPYANSSFKCDPCNMSFLNEMDLEKHKVEHGPAARKKKLFKCGICSKKYAFRSGLHNHLMVSHVNKKDIQCSICGKKFKRMQGLRRHKNVICVAPETITKVVESASEVKVHSPGDSTDADNIKVEIKNFSCSLCGGKFKLENDFRNHMQLHSTEKRCPYCKRLFDRPIILESHIRLHTGEKPFVCPMCLTAFSAARSLRKHVKKHAEKTEYPCNNCANKYLSERELSRHSKSHEQEEATDVSKLEKALSLAENISLKLNSCKDIVFEEQTDISESDPIKEADIPSTSNSNNEWMNIQEYKITPADMSNNLSTSTSVSQLVCKTEPDAEEYPASDKSIEPTVGFEITVKQETSEDSYTTLTLDDKKVNGAEPTVDHLKTDTLQAHSGDASLTLRIINEPISDVERTLQHQYIIDDTIYGRFTCVVPMCKIEFKYCRDLINHYTSQHCMGPPPFKCPVCGNIFPLKIDLRRHLKTHLTCEYKCPFCPKAYSQIVDLNTHLRTHTGERPFSCPKCNKSFKQRSTLRVHIKTHSIVKEYKCNICAKEYFSYNGLFLHMKCHIEIKELQCKFCSKQFPSKSRLIRHQDGICSTRAST